MLISIASPLTRPSPYGRRVGIRIVTFEACLGFTHVTARWIAQPPRGDLCHEAPTHAVTRTSRSSATGSIDNSPVDSSSTDDSRFGAHCQERTYAPQQATCTVCSDYSITSWARSSRLAGTSTPMALAGAIAEFW